MNIRIQSLRNVFYLFTVLFLFAAVCTAPALGAGEHVHDGIEFTEWSGTTSAGHYYLTKNVTLDSVWTPKGEVSLCLNGYVLKRDRGNAVNARVINVNNGKLTIYECNQRNVKYYFTSDDNGLWHFTQDGNMPQYEVTGGVITGGYLTSTYDGAGIYVEDTGELIINGGNIIGNEFKNSVTTPDSQHSGSGLATIGGKITINGGTIQGNAGQWGGGIAIFGTNSGKKGEVIMNGGEISHNTADNGGGGVYLFRGGVFILNGGNVTENTAKYGGGVDVRGTLGTESWAETRLTVTGGNITHNTATEQGGGVYVYQGSEKNRKVEVSGSINITTNTVDGKSNNIYLDQTTVKITVTGQFNEDGIVRISQAGTTAPDTPKEEEVTTNAEYLKGLTFTERVPDTETGELILQYKWQVIPYTPPEDDERPENYNTPIDHVHAGCTCVNEVKQWYAWDKNNRPANGGNYVITKEGGVTFGGDWTVTGDTHLCLNGSSINLNGFHINVTNGAKLYIHDCQKDPHTFYTNSTEIEHLWELAGSPYADSIAPQRTLLGGIIYNGTSENGGGVSVLDMSSLILYNGNIVGNNAIMRSDLFNSGGGVYVKNGTVDIKGGNITGNVVLSAGVGGGIAVINSTLTMSGGNITDNHAHGNGGNGGGVFLYADEANQKITFKMTGGKISGNHAHAYTGHNGDYTNPEQNPMEKRGTGNGGGVFIYSSRDSSAEIDFEGGEISDNIAEGWRDLTESYNAHHDGYGGGIYLYATGYDYQTSHITLKGTKITHNTADDGGGIHVTEGIIRMEDGEISYNSANRGAGYFGYGDGDFLMSGGHIIHNIAEDVDDQELDGGGGVYIDGATFNMTGGEIAYNKVTGIYGNGGGICLDNGTLVLNGTARVHHNNATGGGGNGGGVFIYAGNGVKCSFTMDGKAVVEHNVAITTASPDNSAFYRTSGNGAGIYLYGCEQGKFEVNLINGTIAHNKATSSNGKIPTYGGGLYLHSENYDDLESAKFTMQKGVTIENNTADRGGGLDFEGGHITLDGGTIINNTASRGGGIFLGYGNHLTMKDDVTVTENKAVDHPLGVQWELGGAGVYVNSSSVLHIKGGNITHNNASLDLGIGGGIFVSHDSNLIMEGGNVAYNNATRYAGGVYVKNNVTFILNGTAKILNNTAPNGGGGIVVGTHNAKATLLMSENAVIANNTALNETDGDGGGVAVRGGSLFVMSGGEISGNKAALLGGGVSVYMDSIAGQTAGGEASGEQTGEEQPSTGQTAESKFTRFIINGTAQVHNNSVTAGGHGGGVYVHENESAMDVGGNARIVDNVAGEKRNNLYLPLKGTEPLSTDNSIIAGVTISILADNALTLKDTALIGVTVEQYPQTDQHVNITRTNSENFVRYFFSDNESYHVRNSDATNNVVQLALGAQTYIVRWIDSDGKVLETDENVASGAHPSYDSTTPTSVGNIFIGWSEDKDAEVGKDVENLDPVTKHTDFYAIYETAENIAYVVYIPDTVNLNPDMTQTTEANVTVDNLKLPNGKALAVSVNSTNNWDVVDANNVRVSYNMTWEGGSTDTAERNSAGYITLLKATQQKTVHDLTFQLKEAPVFSGKYSDVLTFAVSITDAPQNSAPETAGDVTENIGDVETVTETETQSKTSTVSEELAPELNI